MMMREAIRTHIKTLLRVVRPHHRLLPAYCFRTFGTSKEEEDPDHFVGPGGLTARQIYQAVQDSLQRDEAAYDRMQPRTAAAARENKQSDVKQKKEMPNDSASSDSHASGQRKEKPISASSLSKEPQNMNVKELKNLLSEHYIDYQDCLEKQELVDRVQSRIIEKGGSSSQ